MIEGVKTKQLVIHHDDRGFFSEVIKFGEDTFYEVKQTSYTFIHPGIIKAFHWHKKQYDISFVMQGFVQAVLFDLRVDSPTYKQTDVYYLNEKNPLLVVIPSSVAHGYRVLGNKPAVLFYHTTEAYNPDEPDEMRIPFDSPEIGFDWNTKNR